MCIERGSERKYITGLAVTKMVTTIVTTVIDHGSHFATEIDLTFPLKTHKHTYTNTHNYFYYKNIFIIDNLENTEKNNFWSYHNSDIKKNTFPFFDVASFIFI